MDDVLNLIRSIVEELDDPPEVPSHAEMRDAEQVEAASQETHRAERFVQDASPELRRSSVAAGVEPTGRFFVPNPGVDATARPFDAGRQAEAIRATVATPPNAEAVARGNEAVKQAAVSQQVRLGPPQADPAIREGTAAVSTDTVVSARSAVPDVRLEGRTPAEASSAEVKQTDKISPFSPEIQGREVNLFDDARVTQGERLLPPSGTIHAADKVTVKGAEPYRPEPTQVKGVEYQIASTPSGLKDTAIVDTLRVAAASVTAALNQRGMPAEVDPTLGARVDSQQVTPSIRVVTMIPDGFPIDANHAFSIMDRNINIPPSEMGPFPDIGGDFLSFPEPSSEEFVNQNSQDISLSEDLVDRSGF